MKVFSLFANKRPVQIAEKRYPVVWAENGWTVLEALMTDGKGRPNRPGGKLNPT